jgi:hypothetical protein
MSHDHRDLDSDGEEGLALGAIFTVSRDSTSIPSLQYSITNNQELSPFVLLLTIIPTK